MFYFVLSIIFLLIVIHGLIDYYRDGNDDLQKYRIRVELSHIVTFCMLCLVMAAISIMEGKIDKLLAQQQQISEDSK